MRVIAFCHWPLILEKAHQLKLSQFLFYLQKVTYRCDITSYM